MKKVSVIVPCYNSSSYIDRCVDSLVNQTLEDIEIILIDDKSTDDTLEKLKNYESLYPDKVVVVSLDTNKGLGNARNVGIEYSSGEYIGFVDSDDYVEKDMYLSMYDLGYNNGYSVVSCDYILEYPDKSILNNGKLDEKNLYTNIDTMACNKIYNAGWLKNTHPSFAVGLKYDDVLFTYQYVPYIFSIGYINKAFYHYAIRSDSLLNDRTIAVQDIYDILLQLRDYYKKRRIYINYYEEIEYLFINYILNISYKRACKIFNKKDRYFVLEKGWILLNSLYPKWKKNKYLNNINGLYFRMMNKFFYKFNVIFFK